MAEPSRNPSHRRPSRAQRRADPDPLSKPLIATVIETAVVEGYVIEGHVPAEAMERLVRKRPTIRGLALPGMPGASPGMERYSTERESFDVLSFASDGRSEAFSHHPAVTPAP